MWRKNIEEQLGARKEKRSFFVCVLWEKITTMRSYNLHPDILESEPVLNAEFWIAVIFVSYILMMAYFICCTYISSPFWVGNGLMLIRNRIFVESGINSQFLIICCICYWIVGYVLGGVILNRYPIISRKRLFNCEHNRKENCLFLKKQFWKKGIQSCFFIAIC